MVENKTIQLAQEWDMENPEMDAITVPEGYDAKYIYQLSVIGETKELSADIEDKGGWGVISLETDHMLEQEEIEEYQMGFESEGAICVSDMRLVRQIFRYGK